MLYTDRRTRSCGGSSPHRIAQLAHVARPRCLLECAQRLLGGLDSANSYTRILLSIFGVYEWDHAPAVPPEIILLPRWFYFNIYAMSSWSRAIVVPLSIIWAHRPSCPVPDDCRLDELRRERVSDGRRRRR